MGRPINRKAREKKRASKDSASPDEKKQEKRKKNLLEVNEGNDTSSFDMVSKSEDETVSPPLSKISTRPKKLDAMEKARESLRSPKTAVNKLAVYVATLQKKEEANNKFIQEIDEGVKFLEDEVNTH